MSINLKVVDAVKNSVLTRSTFKGYDACINTYVGCQFGCSYCYVRFFVKDPEKPWGDFVRVRRHVADKLPKEIARMEAGTRIVLGTMTDPYQPEERKHRITRKALEILRDAGSKVSKVGIFTRSPIVEEDAELIASLPNARVHLSITPFPREAMTLVERIPIQTRRRWSVAANLVSKGVRVHVNIAPAIPVLSEGVAEEYCRQIVAAGVSEFFVDPIQPYAQAVDAMAERLQNDSRWPQIKSILSNKKVFLAWKAEYRAEWFAAWKVYGSSKVLATWQDHANHVFEDMATGNILDPRNYDQYENKASDLKDQTPSTGESF